MTHDTHELEAVRNSPKTDLIDQAVPPIVSEIEANKPQYLRLADRRRKLIQQGIDGTDVRIAMFWWIGSIKTRTEYIDAVADEIFKHGWDYDKDLLETTVDGEVKWEKFHNVMQSDIPDKVADAVMTAHQLGGMPSLVDDSIAMLSGRDPDTGENMFDSYLRAVKASGVMWTFDLDRICLDTRIYNALKPAIKGTFRWYLPVNHPETTGYRADARDMTAKEVPVLSHSGDPEHDGEKSYWEDKLKWNPRQYDDMTTLLRDEVAKQIDADIPRDLIQQAAFNTRGRSTFHNRLFNRLLD